jgi:hypothetical protein
MMSWWPLLYFLVISASLWSICVWLKFIGKQLERIATALERPQIESAEIASIARIAALARDMGNKRQQKERLPESADDPARPLA